jgi:signal transduction histidine kinase
VLTLFSLASYVRYRTAAYRAFDKDLLANLSNLKTALDEDLGEVMGRGDGAGGSAPTLSPSQRTTAAEATLEDFRLSGMEAEIRAGADAQTPVARLAGAGAGEVKRPLFDDATWKRLAHSAGASVLSVPDARRSAVMSFEPAPGADRLTLAVADRTTLVEETLGSIRRSLLEFGAAGLALALAGGYWLATRTLRPIDTLTTQAGQMADVVSTVPSHRLQVPNADDELGRMASTFNRLLERIESAVSQLKRFVADAAHELKTPIAVVRAEAELALSSDRTPEAYRESLRAIASESARLSQIVADLTLLAEGQTLVHPVERRLVDLNEMIHEVRRSLRSLASGRGVHVEVDASGCVEYRGDERLLRQIFTNLVENAIKFSPSGGRVGIGVSEQPGFREVRVLDEAPTLGSEDRERVFDRFYRSPQAREADATGSGLGLAIVQWAVGLHGGRVRIEPRLGGGNVFVVELSASGEAAARA